MLNGKHENFETGKKKLSIPRETKLVKLSASIQIVFCDSQIREVSFDVKREWASGSFLCAIIVLRAPLKNGLHEPFILNGMSGCLFLYVMIPEPHFAEVTKES